MKKTKDIISIITLISIAIVFLMAIIVIVINISSNSNNIISISKQELQQFTNQGDEDEEITVTSLEELSNLIDQRIENKLSEENSNYFTIEQGTNYYAKKYDNGIMELYGTYSSTMTTSYTWGSGYYASLVTITFPIEFTEKPYIVPVLSRTGSANVFSLSLHNVTKTTFNFYPYSMGNKVTNASYSVDYVAIGKWK